MKGFLKIVALELKVMEEGKCAKGRALGGRQTGHKLAKLHSLRISQPKCQLHKSRDLGCCDPCSAHNS